jgi:hypothetical protein
MDSNKSKANENHDLDAKSHEEDVVNNPVEYNDRTGGMSSLQSEVQHISSYIDHSQDLRGDSNQEANQIAPNHRRPNFPESLFAILSHQTLSNVITWLPHGRSFMILKPDVFATEVLPKYYRHRNLSSFHRQLSAYGFVRTKKSAVNRDITYYHPSFLRGLPHLLLSIKRCKSGGTCTNRISENDLYRISETSPVPLHMDPQDPTSQAIADINTSVYTEEVAESLTSSFQRTVNTLNALNQPIPEAVARPNIPSVTQQCPLPPSQPTNNQSERFAIMPLAFSQLPTTTIDLQHTSVVHRPALQPDANNVAALQTVALLYQQLLNQQTQAAQILASSGAGLHMNLSQPPLNRQGAPANRNIEVLRNLVSLLLAFYQAQQNNSNG